MTAVPNVTLSNDVQMPIIGFGTWQSSPDVVKQAITVAIDVGYRHIDTAAIYDNEKEIGDALQEAYKAGKVKREELFIVTKLWCTHNREADVEPALRESLTRLQTDYVDLYLIHQPGAFDHEMKNQDHTVRVEDVWKGMESVYEKKLTRAIGVSNFSIEQHDRIMRSARVPIHNTQVELHLNFGQFALRDYCRQKNISVCAYAPLGSPGRVEAKRPDGGKFKWTKPVEEPMKNPVVTGLADKYKKTPAQVLLRHLIQRGIIVIPKSVTPSRIEENFQVFDFELTAEEVEELNKQPQGNRLFLQDFLAGHPEDPWKEDREKAQIAEQ